MLRAQRFIFSIDNVREPTVGQETAARSGRDHLVLDETDEWLDPR